MIRSPLFLRAREFAIAAHGDQKYGSDPYVTHLDAVVAVLDRYEADEPLLVSGLLHDVPEDTKETIDTVRVEFGEEVGQYVWAVTGEGANRKARVASLFPKLLVFPRAVILKLSDRFVNGSCSRANNPDKYRMYRKEHPEFFLRLGHLGPQELWAEVNALFVDRNPN